MRLLNLCHNFVKTVHLTNIAGVLYFFFWRLPYAVYRASEKRWHILRHITSAWSRVWRSNRCALQYCQLRRSVTIFGRFRRNHTRSQRMESVYIRCAGLCTDSVGCRLRVLVCNIGLVLEKLPVISRCLVWIVFSETLLRGCPRAHHPHYPRCASPCTDCVRPLEASLKRSVVATDKDRWLNQWLLALLLNDLIWHRVLTAKWHPKFGHKCECSTQATIGFSVHDYVRSR